MKAEVQAVAGLEREWLTGMVLEGIDEALLRDPSSLERKEPLVELQANSPFPDGNAAEICQPYIHPAA